MITNDGQVEMVNDESPDVAKLEKGWPICSQPGFGSLRSMSVRRQKQPIELTSPRKKWFALVDFPMVTGCKYQSKNWVALE